MEHGNYPQNPIPLDDTATEHASHGCTESHTIGLLPSGLTLPASMSQVDSPAQLPPLQQQYGRAGVYTPARGQFIERAKRLQHADLCEDKFVPQTSSPVGTLPGYAAGNDVQSHGAQLQFSSSDTNRFSASCTARDSYNPVLFAQQECSKSDMPSRSSACGCNHFNGLPLPTWFAWHS